MLIDPKYLIQLHMIVELGSFISAAERLGLTQPGLTRNIRLLEARIGARLLIRGKHGAIPTDEGKALAAFGRMLYEVAQQAASVSSSVHRGEFGRIRLGASFSVCNGLIAEPISRFLSSRPKTSIKVVSGPTLRLLEELDAGRLDLVVGGTQVLSEDHGLRFEPLMENELLVIGGVTHPLRDARNVTPASLQNFRWVVSIEEDPLRSDVEAAMASLRVKGDNVGLETSSLSLIIDVLNQADFLTMIPSALALPLVQLGRVSRLHLKNKFPLRPIGVAYRKNNYTSPAASAFIATLRDWAEGHAGGGDKARSMP